jgi:hypothetical protein
LATERLIPGENHHSVVGAKDRKGIDIIVPVYKSVHLTTRCLDSLADHIHDIASSDPRLIVINDSPGESDVHRMLESFECATGIRHDCYKHNQLAKGQKSRVIMA